MLSVLYLGCYLVFFFKQKTAYEMRISDWSSDVCSSDLSRDQGQREADGKNGQETGFLGDIQQIAGRREVRRGQREEARQDQSRDCRAVLFQDEIGRAHV